MAERRTKRSVRIYRTAIGSFLLFMFAGLAFYAIGPAFGEMTYTATSTSPIAIATSTVPVVPEGRQATHVSTPDPVKGIYMTSCVASTPSLRENLVKLLDDTELNSVVIDIKSFDGYVSFPTSPDLAFSKGGCFVKGMQDFIDELHAHHIYVIGRVASFQDQLMVKLHPEQAVKKETATSTVWRDYKGIAWIDPSSKDQWKYLTDIAAEAHAIGFDEINFDYIRFPADGNMKDIWYPLSGTGVKSDIIRSFYEYLHRTLSPQGITISGDIFGMTTTNSDDLGIGQLLENALPNFDYVMPMVYPSHYPNGFMNLGDPNAHVYEVVNFSMEKAVERAIATTTKIAIPDARIGTSTPAIYGKPSFSIAKLRPWLQDNNYPVTYTPEMVMAQIKAANDAGVSSWSLWNAGNHYTRSALEASTTGE